LELLDELAVLDSKQQKGKTVGLLIINQHRSEEIATAACFHVHQRFSLVSSSLVVPGD